MDFLKKNKIVVGLIAAVVIVLILVVGFNLFRGGVAGGPGGSSSDRQNVIEVDPEEIGLELEIRSDGNAIIITATKIDGIEGLEYELTYDAEDTFEGETNVIPRGAVGRLNISGGIASAEVDLGTCSSGVCKYDKVVSDINVLIKIDYENGEVGAAETQISLEE